MKARWKFATIMILLLLAQTLLAQNKSVMVIAPHPDDEALIASGIISAAKARGDSVKVVVVTNGDYNGTATGLIRLGESVAAMGLLGVSEQDVIFLGYGDGSILLPMYETSSPTTIFTSHALQTKTYGNRGLNGMSWHKNVTGVEGDYNQQTIMEDFRSLLRTYRPNEIYTTGAWEDHHDHEATYLYTVGAAIAELKAGNLSDTRIHESVIHAKCEFCDPNFHWPEPAFTPSLPFYEPPTLNSTSYSWDQIENVPVPASMQDPDFNTNLKRRAIAAYQTQGGGWLFSFVKKNEFFWVRDFSTNIAVLATATASSQDFGQSQQASKAIDGIYVGYPYINSGEWATTNQTSGAWIKLTWDNPVTISRVVLYDRVNTVDNINSGTLKFSDNTTIAVGALPPNGDAYEITFPPKTTTSLQFTIDNGEGFAVGLSEFEAFGKLATSTSNHAPQITRGPIATPSAIADVESANLMVDPFDVDGDTLTYAWTTDGGVIVGSGPEVSYFPPQSSSQAIYTVTVTITDTHGASVQNSTFISVNPVLDSLQLDPSFVLGGGSVTGTVTLNSPAPVDGAVVTLTKNPSGVASIPTSVKIVAGATSANFTVNTSNVSSTVPVVLGATYNGATQKAILDVTTSNVLAVASVSLNPSSVTGGNPSTGTVTLSGAAPAGGAIVVLSSNSPSASVPSNVTVLAGNNSATFPVNTSSVSNATSATITASYNGSSQTGTLSVNVVTVALSALSLNPTSVIGGNNSTGTVTLTLAAPAGGALVTLSSSNTTAASVPPNVTVPAGSTQATFTVTTTAVGVSVPVTISASYSGSTLNSSLNVTSSASSNLAALSTVTVSSQNTQTQQLGIKAIDGVVDGYPGNYTKEWATVNQLAGAWIRLTWSSPVTASEINLYDRPNTVDNVRSGTLSFSDGSSIAVGTLPNNGAGLQIIFPPKTITWVQFTVDTAVGGNIGLAEISVFGVNSTVVSNLAVNPTSVAGGSTSAATVTLSQAAPAGGALVSLSSNNAAAVVPASITVPSGLSTANFSVTTTAVASTIVASISATYNTTTQSANLTVQPPALVSVTLDKSTVAGGTGATGTLTLDGPAPVGGLAVALVSDYSATQVPASVNIAAGATSANFNVTTSVVAASVVTTISATSNGLTTTATLTVDPPALTGVSVSPATVIGGAGVTGTVTIDSSAPVGGLVVALSSDTTSAAQVPANVTVPEGATTATFAVATSAVGSAATVTITAVFNSLSQTTTLVVNPPTFSGVTLNPVAVVGGVGSTGTVALGSPAPAGGVAVALSSTNTVIAQVPANVVVPAGATSADFAITTTPVGAATAVTIGADWNGNNATSNLTVNPPVLTTVAVNPNDVTGGNGTTGTVNLGSAAPTGGLLVTLSSSNTGAAQVPANVTVTAGATTANFAITTTAVAANEAVMITASWNGDDRTANLTVRTPTLSGLTLNPTAVAGGTDSTGTVNLGSAAPGGGVEITLTSDHAAAQVPATVSVPEGANSIEFVITTTAVAGATNATITASWAGNVVTSNLTINPPVLSSVEANPTVVTGGVGSTGTVSLGSAAPAGGIVVTLASDNLGAAQVPANVTVVQGATTAIFSITTHPVGSSTPVTLSASWSGVTRTTTITVNPPALSAVSVNPTSVVGGASSTGTVTLASAAPAGGLAVSLASSDVAAQVPATVTVPAGNTTANFNLTTSSVATATPVTISASFNGVTQSANLAVNPPGVTAVSMNPTTVTGGSSSTGTVTLSSPAPVGGATVTLSDDSASATTPASVTVAAGATSAIFTVTTAAGANTTVTITAAYNGTATATLTIIPTNLSAVSVNPTSVVGGNNATGTVTLTSAAPAGGIVVQLSDNSTAATVPASVTVAAGATTATFTITTAGVASATPVTITAQYAITMRTATLNVNPASLTSVAMSPTSVPGGANSTGTVTLTGNAPPGGALVTLSDNNAAATVPVSVTIQEGARTATFTATTVPVSTNTSVTVTASYLGVNRTATLTVSAATLSSVTATPNPVIGGNNATGTVTFTGIVAVDRVVTLTSSSTAAATVPANVTVLAGTNSATFTITTFTTSASNTRSTITASFGGINRTVRLEVDPPNIASLSLSPTSVTGGATSTGTVTLDGPAPSGGRSVTLSSSSTAIATVPASVTVPAGALSATFTVTSKVVATPSNVTISGTRGVTRTAVLTVTP